MCESESHISKGVLLLFRAVKDNPQKLMGRLPGSTTIPNLNYNLKKTQQTQKTETAVFKYMKM